MKWIITTLKTPWVPLLSTVKLNISIYRNIKGFHNQLYQLKSAIRQFALDLWIHVLIYKLLL